MHLSNVCTVLSAVRNEARCVAQNHARKTAEWYSECTGTNGQLLAPAYSPGTFLNGNVTAGWSNVKVDLKNVTKRKVLCLSRSSLELEMK
jgi:hypothetical protein